MRGRVNTDLYSGIAINAVTDEFVVKSSSITAGDFVEYKCENKLKEFNHENSANYITDGTVYANNVYELTSIRSGLYIGIIDDKPTLFTYANEEIEIIYQYTLQGTYWYYLDKYDDTIFMSGQHIFGVTANSITLLNTYNSLQNIRYFSQNILVTDQYYAVKFADITSITSTEINAMVSLLSGSSSSLITEYIIDKDFPAIYYLYTYNYSGSSQEYKVRKVTINETDMSVDYVEDNFYIGGVGSVNTAGKLLMLDAKKGVDGFTHIIFLFYPCYNSSLENPKVYINSIAWKDIPTVNHQAQCIIRSEEFETSIDYSALTNGYLAIPQIDYLTNSIVIVDRHDNNYTPSIIHLCRFNIEPSEVIGCDFYEFYLDNFMQLPDGIYTDPDRLSEVNTIFNFGMNNSSVYNKYVLLGDNNVSVSGYYKLGYINASIRGDVLTIGSKTGVKSIDYNSNINGMAVESGIQNETIKVYIPMISIPVPTPGIKTGSWANASDDVIIGMLNAYYQDQIDIYDYWDVGDIRRIKLSAMAAGDFEAHPEQIQEFVLLNKGGVELVTPINNHNECAFVVGMRDKLVGSTSGSQDTAESGVININGGTIGGWDECDRRTWCNTTFRNAVPEKIRPRFKQHKVITGAGPLNQSQYDVPVVSNDYFTLPSVKEVTNRTDLNCEQDNVYLEYYQTQANRIKYRRHDTSLPTSYFLRTPGWQDNYWFLINSSGNAASNYSNNKNGISVQTVI